MKTKQTILMLLCAVIFCNLSSNAQNEITVCANETEFVLSVSRDVLPAHMKEGGSGQPANFFVDFGQPISPNVPDPLKFTNFSNFGGSINSNGGITINIPQNPKKIYPNYYNNASVTLTNTYNNCTETFYFKIKVLYQNTIIEQKFDNVLALLTDNYNGGYHLQDTGTQYQWYKNGNKLSGETKSYVYFHNQTLVVGDEYYVEIKRPGNTFVFSCPLVARKGNPESEYPFVFKP